MLVKVIFLPVVLLGTLGVTFFALAFVIPPTDMTGGPSLTPAAITQLTHDPANALHPACSPDNRLIAFESNREGPFHIYVMNADGSGARALTRVC